MPVATEAEAFAFASAKLEPSVNSTVVASGPRNLTEKTLCTDTLTNKIKVIPRMTAVAVVHMRKGIMIPK